MGVRQSCVPDRHIAPARGVRDERDRLRFLLDVTNLLVTQHDLGTLLQSLSGCIGRLVQHEYASVSFYDGARDRLRVRLVVLDGERVPALEHRAIQLTVEAAGLLAAGEVVVFDDAVLQQRNTELARTFEPEGLRSFCSVP